MIASLSALFEGQFRHIEDPKLFLMSSITHKERATGPQVPKKAVCRKLASLL